MATLTTGFRKRQFTNARAGLTCPTRFDDYRARAAECQQIADGWSGLLKDQYEQLARQWLMLAEQAAAHEPDRARPHH